MHNTEIQQSFDRTAEYYGCRLPPYVAELFSRIASLLDFDEETKILDLGCGQGEVSGGLSGYIGSAVGLDFSPKMLELAHKDNKITYVQHDINAAPYVAETEFDHFFIGRAIQWIHAKNLQMTIDTNLRKGGAVAILGTDWAKETQWLGAYREVRRRYGQGRRRPDAREPGRPLERYGRAKLASMGVEPVERLVRKYPLCLTVEDLLKNVLSYVFVENIDKLRNDLFGGLSDFLAPDNTLVATIENWALIYKRAEASG
jgi:SAM-dependent methyltransferase